MATTVYYLWYFKPDETQRPPMEYINHNLKYFPKYQILSERDVMQYVNQFPKLSAIWPRIPWWIVRADIARLLVVYFNGGFYFDVDARVTKPIEPAIQQFSSNQNQNQNRSMYLFTEKILSNTSKLGSREDKSNERRLRIANYAFGSIEKRDPFLLECINECIKRLHIILNELYQSSTGKSVTQEDILWIAGPDVITSIYHKFKNRQNVYLFDQTYVKNKGFASWRSDFKFK